MFLRCALESVASEHFNQNLHLILGICGQSQQTQADSGDFVAQSRQARRVSHPLSHGAVRGRAVQRRESVSYQADKGAEAYHRRNHITAAMIP